MPISNATRLNCNPMRVFGGQGILNDLCTTQTRRWTMPRSLGKTTGYPAGYRPPCTWVLPQESGRLSSYRAAIASVSATGTGAKGVSSLASSTLVFSASATGANVRWGIGSAPITISADGQIVAIMRISGDSDFLIGSGTTTLSAIAWRSGSSEMLFTVEGNGSLGIAGTGSAEINISAIASGNLAIAGIGSASFNVSANGDIVSHMSISGSSPITVSATLTKQGVAWLKSNSEIQIVASMVSFAYGKMSGSTEAQNVLTADSISTAVWQKIISDITTAGSAASALKSAGSSGDPWGSILGAYPAGTAGKFIDELYRLAGLKFGVPVTVTKTSVAFGDVEMTITGDGENTSTIERV
jgi:hypothetical protein